jgi:putative membrane protein
MSLQTTVGKLIYVGCVTFFATCLGCWALLAHQEGLPSGRVMADEQFAKEAAQGGMAEVALGQMAEEHGSNPDVKAFAQRMIVQHSRANDQLKQVAAKAGIPLPNEIAPKDHSTQERLAKLTATEFDREYAKMMVEDHQKDLAAFQREAAGGKNQDLKSFASESLPMLRQHLNQARELLKAVSPSVAGHTVIRRNRNAAAR